MTRDTKVRFTRTSRTIVKAIIIILILGGAIYAASWYHTQENTVVYQAPEAEAVEVVQENDVTRAAKMLAEATEKLNKEEEKLLASKLQIETEAAREIAEIQAKASARVAEIESEVEAINQIRSSF